MDGNCGTDKCKWGVDPLMCGARNQRLVGGLHGDSRGLLGSPTESLQVAAVAVSLDPLGLLSCGVLSTASSSLCLWFSTQTADNIPVREQARGGALSEGFE